MSKDYTEDLLVQKPTAEFMQQLGWAESINGYEEVEGDEYLLGRSSHKEVVLTRYLRPALEKLNPGRPVVAYEQALRIVATFNSAKTLLQNNQEQYHMLRQGVPVSYQIDGEVREERLRLIDWEHADANRWLIVRELWMRHDIYHRRADIVGFVNGIPLLFIECKAHHKDLRLALDGNISDYKDTVPNFLAPNAIMLLGNGMDGLYGSLTSSFEHFGEWKRLAEEDAAASGSLKWQMILQGMAKPQNFLDLVENFILFDSSAGHTAKIIARNHQYLGVNKALAAIQDRKVRKGKLGVFWHTQGSGKSYSMVFLAEKAHRRLAGSFTFVILTDRTELDGQIFDTFVGCGVLGKTDKVQAGSGTGLHKLLTAKHRYVFSLIQKFNQEGNEVYSQRDDVIVISDEAHRTQYGRLAKRMRSALPNASFLGFTGTPLMGGSDDELTKDVFGDYISTYDFQRAVEDGATVPLYYDNRGEKLELAYDSEELNEKLANVIDEYELDENQRAKLDRELANHPVITSTKRLRHVAQDLVAHYTDRWRTGKVMLVCIDKITCVRMHGFIAEAWAERIADQHKKINKSKDAEEAQELRKQLEWLETTQSLVVVSDEQNEVKIFEKWKLDIKPHRTLMNSGLPWVNEITGQKSSLKLEDAFKKQDHPFRLAIVCAMWLTGFDVKSLSTLYIDKPMKGHTLMQAIARANRVNEGKDNGLIVDYSGVLKSLRKALALYAKGKGDGGTGGDNPLNPPEDLLKRYGKAVVDCCAHIDSCGGSVQAIIKPPVKDPFSKLTAINNAVEAICTTAQTRATFEVMVRDVFRLSKSLTARTDAYKYFDREEAIDAVNKRLMKKREIADITDVLVKLHGVVDDAVAVKQVKDAGSDSGNRFDISKIDFDRLKQEFAKRSDKNTQLMVLEQAVSAQINRMMRKNPLRTDFYERFQKIIEDYNEETDRATIEQTFEELLNLVENLNKEEKRGVREGLNEEQLAIFDLLVEKKNDLNSQQRNKVKAVAADLLSKVKATLDALDHWWEKDGTKAQIRNTIEHALYGDGDRTLPDDAYEVNDLEALTTSVYLWVLKTYAQVG